MDINELRKRLDAIDDEIVKLYLERMSVVRDVGECKKSTGKSIADPSREKDILLRIMRTVPDELKNYVEQLFNTVFSTSKAYQSATIGNTNDPR